MKAPRFSRWLILPVLATALLTACDFFDVLRSRFAVLSLNFGFASLNVSDLVYPGTLLQMAQDAASGDASKLAGYGVNIRCGIRVENPNSQRAVLDAMTARLRVSDTTAGAPSIAAAINAFSVDGGADTVLNVVFPLRLNSPVFSRSVWTAIVEGADMPYRVSAETFVNLVIPNGLGGQDTLATRPLEFSVAKGNVNAYEKRQTILDAFLALIHLAL